MICSRCKGSAGKWPHKSGPLMFCLPCATLLASFLGDTYWPPTRPRDVIRDDLRRSLGWWKPRAKVTFDAVH